MKTNFRSCLPATAVFAALLASACGAESSGGDPGADAGKGGDPTSEGAHQSSSGGAGGEQSAGDVTLGMGTDGSDGASVSSEPSVTDPGGFVSVGTSDAGTFEVWCGSHLCACSDGIDNDEDGVADGFDTECTGPFDDNEATFATGIPGDNRDPKWQDCFFDGNSGAGDDGCRYHTECLTGDRAPDDSSCALTDACVEYCQPLTPPGCDCFGCCEIDHAGGTVNVLLSETCSLENLDDEQACPRCVPTDTCKNDCGECELCLGKTLADLPESCFGSPPDTDVPDASTPPGTDMDGGSPPPVTSGGDPVDPPDGPGNVCDVGDPCASTTECSEGDYCRLGCCVPFQSNIR